MSNTANKLLYLSQTKNAIKEAIVEKGVEVTATDTFRSYANKIRNIQTGSGSSSNTRKIYAKNYSSTIPQKDDKVLIKYGTEAGTELETEFTTGNSSSTKYVHPMIFYDNNTIICSYGEDSGKRLEYIDNSWSSVDYPFEYRIARYTYEYVHNHIITSSPFNGTGNGYLLDVNNAISVAYCKYLGSYNGVHYAQGDSSNANDVFVFDFDNKTVTTTQAINGPSTRRNGFLRGDKIFLYSSNNRATLYQNIDGTYTKYADITTSTLETFVAVTGLEIGDYLFSITNPNAYSDLGTTAESYLKVFQIQEDTGTYSAKIVEVTVPELEWLKITDCRITYDIRTNVLMVGTKDGVYGYVYGYNNKEGFTDIQLNLGLPTTTGQTYMAVMSPNCNKILVSSPYIDNIYYFPFIIFALDEDGWSIIDNKTLNYQPIGVHTGYATGNVNEENKYEVEYLPGKGTPIIDW